MSITKILVIDDDQGIHDLVDGYLEGIGDKIFHALYPEQGIKLAHHERPDLILLDYEMPEMDGFQVCLQLKETVMTRDIPIIFITIRDQVNLIARALDFGAIDFLTKPFHPVELQARVRSALRTKRFIDHLKLRSRKDSLTDLYNTTAFNEALGNAVAIYNRDHLPFGILLLSVFKLKELNHTYGHGVGDEVLQRVAEIIQYGVRMTDTYARFSGTRFAVIFPNTDIAYSREVSFRIVSEVKELKIPTEKKPINIALCGGLSFTPDDKREISALELINAAEEALYKAYEMGEHMLVLNPLESSNV